MAADALVARITRSSATMILMMWNEDVLDILESESHQMLQSWGMIWVATISFYVSSNDPSHDIYMLTMWCLHYISTLTSPSHKRNCQMNDLFLYILRKLSFNFIKVIDSSSVQIQSLNMVITVPADGLAPDTARPSAARPSAFRFPLCWPEQAVDSLNSWFVSDLQKHFAHGTALQSHGPFLFCLRNITANGKWLNISNVSFHWLWPWLWHLCEK